MHGWWVGAWGNKGHHTIVGCGETVKLISSHLCTMVVQFIIVMNMHMIIMTFSLYNNS